MEYGKFQKNLIIKHICDVCNNSFSVTKNKNHREEIEWERDSYEYLRYSNGYHIYEECQREVKVHTAVCPSCEHDEILFGELTGGKKRRESKEWIDDGCFIATEVYGDINAPEVKTLRKFRDDSLSKNYFGRKFINFYYSGFGKRTAHLIGRLPFTKDIIKKRLDFMVLKINKREGK